MLAIWPLTAPANIARWEDFPSATIPCCTGSSREYTHVETVSGVDIYRRTDCSIDARCAPAVP